MVKFSSIQFLKSFAQTLCCILSLLHVSLRVAAELDEVFQRHSTGREGLEVLAHVQR